MPDAQEELIQGHYFILLIRFIIFRRLAYRINCSLVSGCPHARANNDGNKLVWWSDKMMTNYIQISCHADLYAAAVFITVKTKSSQNPF